MNASIVHSHLFYKYASHSLLVAAMASMSKKRSAVFCEDEVRECLLLSELEQSLSDSEFDTENELDNHAFLDAVVNYGSDEDDSATQDFVWENMQNYKGQRENFTGSVGPQGAAKHVTESVDIF
jgi:cytochrome c556